jgi:hypothetical protein
MMRCQQFVRRFVRGPTGAYRRAFLSLLLSAGAIFALMTFTACDCDNNGVDDCDTAANSAKNAQIASLNNQLNQQAQPAVQAKIYSKTRSLAGAAITAAPAAGTRAMRILTRILADSTTATKITYTYTPPAGASDFTFSPQPEPGWDPAAPVFIFRDVPISRVAVVELTLPAASPYGGRQAAESLTIQPDVGPATTAYYLTDLTAAVTHSDGDDAPAPAAAPSANVDMWRVQRWYKRDVPINSDLCQQAVDLLQSDAAFIALQLPERPHAANVSTLLPVYRNTPIGLRDYSNNGLSVAGAGTFRPGRFTFAANELPAAQNKIWVTFGAAMTPTLTCPAGKATSAWEIELDFQLDLSYAPNSCRGCVLDVFICYEGQKLPGSRLAKYVARQQANRALEQLVRTGDGPASVRDYRDWGITCAGPLPLQLIDDPNWQKWKLVGASAQWITPTWPITLAHTLEGGNFTPAELIDLTFSSNLDAGWRWSDGTQFITPPIEYVSWKDIFLVGQVPAGAPAGMYSAQITASLRSEPTDYRVATDLIWVGAWSPPPQGETPRRKLYLPLVLR